eukprot:CAMPEP_0206212276 /NCGR_PEP_ID=MMETSP0047_2-20121206/470_1 /ASSEMBLY_ACC=CAM_ASM_000192 /TAXON_ID=195065 /ORGANISM="Chroomonas mesostigmatica_cf, Strain CCMP1168" /LENGTH=145 /DNA_ID=CAMNT_0053634283 /DNA_START=1 /DNA_END=438 /DNA_ORIENTATION=-
MRVLGTGVARVRVGLRGPAAGAAERAAPGALPPSVGVMVLWLMTSRERGACGTLCSHPSAPTPCPHARSARIPAADNGCLGARRELPDSSLAMLMLTGRWPSGAFRRVTGLVLEEYAFLWLPVDASLPILTPWPPSRKAPLNKHV